MKWLIVPALLAMLFLAADRLYLIVCRRPGPRQMRQIEKRRKKNASLPHPHKEVRDINDFADLLAKGQQWALEQPFRTVQVESDDGLRLSGRCYEVENARCTVLCVHGYHSTGLKDFGVILPFYLEHGCNVLVVDQRAHGESEGKYITFGVKERQDICRWAEFLADGAPERPVFLDGVSMGAASVLMSLALSLPKQVCGVIADCGYTTPAAIFEQVLRTKTRLPAWLVLPVVGVCWRLHTGCSMTGASAPAALKKSKMPVLFVHGADDAFVPAEMSRENYRAAAGEKELVLVPKAGHAASWLVDEAGCGERLLRFMQAHLPAMQKDLKA